MTQGGLLGLDIMAVAMCVLDEHTVVTQLLLRVESIQRHGTQQVFTVSVLRIVRLYKAFRVSVLLVVLECKVLLMLV